jgi:hypothetical protein
MNDSISVFLNLHHDRYLHWDILRDRMRTTKPGILLNWAWYYPRWKQQIKDPTLDRNLYLDGTPRFCQAHFFFREKQILDRFPGSKSVTLRVKNIDFIDIYLRYAHCKLLDKKLYNSWYEIQKLNYPLTIKENIDFADHRFQMGMTPLQYRSIAWQDWQNRLAIDCDDPVAAWNQHPYHDNFMENRSTVEYDMLNWTSQDDRMLSIYIDELIDIPNQKFNHSYYIDICDMLNLKPDLQFFNRFWQHWLSRQPNYQSHAPQLSWNLRV